jgi:hypothetical protein
LFLVRELRTVVEEVVEAVMIMPPVPESEKRIADSESTSWAIPLEKENSARLRWDGSRRVVCKSVKSDLSG